MYERNCRWAKVSLNTQSKIRPKIVIYYFNRGTHHRCAFDITHFSNVKKNVAVVVVAVLFLVSIYHRLYIELVGHDLHISNIHSITLYMY